jgi:Arc/MetJ-type ribon-helix-helix transcriptional regulator
MEVQLTTDQKALARHAVEKGRLSSEEAVQEALALWEDRERRRLVFLSSLDDSRASLARGEGRVITQESMRELAAEVRERACPPGSRIGLCPLNGASCSAIGGNRS